MGARSSQEADQLLRPVAEVYGTNARWLRVRTADYFGVLDFSGKRVLDIGAGRGLYACCVAALGAEQVVALEPQLAGARDNTITSFQQRIEALNLTNLDLKPIAMQDCSAPAQSFDIIYMLAVINHLDERHVRTLHTDENSRRAYRALMRPLYNWLKPGGYLIISDASSSHAYTYLIDLGLLKKHPSQPHIKWDIHQRPQVWQGLLEEVGFTAVQYHWATNWRYPWMPRFLVDNMIAAHLYSSSFVLRARRPS
jgi:2-polyprenyl-3-methyl-5-hydroxy-6-metoxy-1,4-benzoquinol methylase